MPRKGKKRREAHRERKLERAEATPPSVEEEVARLARAKAKAEHESERMRRKAHRDDSGGLNPWYVGLPVGGAAIAGIIVLAVVLLGGGGGSEATPSPTRDPRLKGPSTATLNVEATGEENGSIFVPDTLTIKTGEVTEIVVHNAAQRVSHNMRVSGEDGKYETDDPKNLRDDWLLPIVKAGETGRLELVINKPGSYKLQCDFHPQTQFGTLIVQ